MPYRVLIIGCGNIAGGFDADRPEDAPPLTHAGAFARDPRFAMTACVDPDEGRRTAFAERWQVPVAAADLASLDAAPGAFDVISICSPTDLHEDHFTQALTLSPKLIFCEKPVATTALASERLIAAAAEAGVRLAVNHTRRWAPDVVELAAQLQGGAWGAIRSAHGLYTKGVVHNGGHMVDLLRLLLGELSIDAAGAPVRDHWDRDPSVPALLRSAAGVPVHLSVGHAADYAVFELTLVTERGTIAMLDGGASWALRRVQDSNTFAGYRVLGPVESVAGRYDLAMPAAVANIADALDNDAPLASDGGNALAAQRLCEAIRDAAASTSTRITE